MATDLTLEPGLQRISVERAMHPGVLTCAPETPLRDVARMMARYRIHAVVVFTEDDESEETPAVWGVVSDADLVGAAAVSDVEGRTAGGTARSPLVTVQRHDTLQHAAELMKQHGATHVLVTSPFGERPLGIVSTLDVAKAIALDGSLDA